MKSPDTPYVPAHRLSPTRAQSPNTSLSKNKCFNAVIREGEQDNDGLKKIQDSFYACGRIYKKSWGNAKCALVHEHSDAFNCSPSASQVVAQTATCLDVSSPPFQDSPPELRRLLCLLTSHFHTGRQIRAVHVSRVRECKFPVQIYIPEIVYQFLSTFTYDFTKLILNAIIWIVKFCFWRF
jgi:hypothetical protein